MLSVLIKLGALGKTSRDLKGGGQIRQGTRKCPKVPEKESRVDSLCVSEKDETAQFNPKQLHGVTWNLGRGDCTLLEISGDMNTTVSS